MTAKMTAAVATVSAIGTATKVLVANLDIGKPHAVTRWGFPFAGGRGDAVRRPAKLEECVGRVGLLHLTGGYPD